MKFRFTLKLLLNNIRSGFVQYVIISCIFFLSSCSVSQQIARQATSFLLKDSAVGTGHIGLSIYEPATNSYWYNYNAAKYFVPASNIKLFSLYAGMKYLGDSLIGLKYSIDSNTTVHIQATGDPTFLHPDYKNQPVFDFLRTQQKITFYNSLYGPDGLGKGWAWGDYLYPYMAQRSEFPIYGNLIRLYTDVAGRSSIPNRISIDMQEGFDTSNTNVEYVVNRPWDKNNIILSAKSPAPTKKIIMK